jgi:hypothetical protein
MLFVTKYKVRGDRSNERTAELMATFGERGPIPGTVSQYNAVDGSFGFVIIDTDDSAALYEATLAYSQWLEFEITPIIAMEDAVPHITASLK